jgi:hypothetical protein
MHKFLATATGAVLASALIVACSTSEQPAPLPLASGVDATAVQAVQYFGDQFAEAHRRLTHTAPSGEPAPTF